MRGEHSKRKTGEQVSRFTSLVLSGPVMSYQGSSRPVKSGHDISDYITDWDDVAVFCVEDYDDSRFCFST
jgi:hypothetical protein